MRKFLFLFVLSVLLFIVGLISPQFSNPIPPYAWFSFAIVTLGFTFAQLIKMKRNDYFLMMPGWKKALMYLVLAGGVCGAALVMKVLRDNRNPKAPLTQEVLFCK